MFESDKDEGLVRPIRFTPLAEDVPKQKQQQQQTTTTKRRTAKSSREDSIKMTNINHLEHHLVSGLRKRTPPRPNFSLEYQYPAVTLEDVSFSVDKSQLQSNFLNECLCRLSQCLGPLCSRDKQRADDSKIQILKSINLSVPHGTIFGLLGPSSCGKTTLLRCLVGLLEPDSGSIRLFGSSSFSRRATGKSSPGSGKLCFGGARRDF